jgi:GAF domain-containing protein
MDKPGPLKKTPSGRLAEINRAITTSLNFDKVLDSIVESAQQLVEARSCVLLLIDKDGTLRVRAARGTTPEFAGEFSASMDEDAVRKLHEALSGGAGRGDGFRTGDRDQCRQRNAGRGAQSAA